MFQECRKRFKIWRARLIFRRDDLVRSKKLGRAPAMLCRLAPNNMLKGWVKVRKVYAKRQTVFSFLPCFYFFPEIDTPTIMMSVCLVNLSLVFSFLPCFYFFPEIDTHTIMMSVCLVNSGILLSSLVFFLFFFFHLFKTSQKIFFGCNLISSLFFHRLIYPPPGGAFGQNIYRWTNYRSI